MQSAGNLAFALILVLAFVLIGTWSTGRRFRFSPVLLFYVIFVLQQAIGCMLLAQQGVPHAPLARLGLELGVVGLTALSP